MGIETEFSGYKLAKRDLDHSDRPHARLRMNFTSALHLQICGL
jgi:hypothetical protein